MIGIKTKLMAAMGVVIITLAVLLYLSERRSQTRKTERDQAINFSLAAKDSLRSYVNKYGKVVAKVEVLELTVKNLQRLQDHPSLEWIKEIEAVNKRLNNVEQISTYTATVVGDFKIPIKEDSLPDPDGDGFLQVRTFDNQDKWLRVSGVVLPDTIEVIPFVKVNIKSVLLWERDRWPLKKFGLKIGRKQYSLHGLTDNPYATIIGMEVTEVVKKRSP